MPNRNVKKALAALALAMVFIVAPLLMANASPKTLKCVKTVPNGFVCLTIDDGYGRDRIKKALAVLRANGVHCTFFVIGTQLTRFADLWRQAVKDGNEICYHTMRHQSVTHWSNARIIADVKAWNKTAKKVLGSKYSIPKFARLPGGAGSSNQRILKLFNASGYRVVYWSSDTLTGAVNRHKPIDRYIKSTTKKGSIILTHFNGYDVPALSKYIGWLKKHFKLRTLSQAFAPLPTLTRRPTVTPARTPTAAPTTAPTAPPTSAPTPVPTSEPSPTVTPEPSPSAAPELSPTASPELTDTALEPSLNPPPE